MVKNKWKSKIDVTLAHIYSLCSFQIPQSRTLGILLPISEIGPGIGRSHDLKISSICGVQLW
jgi:hypothetical protein